MLGSVWRSNRVPRVPLLATCCRLRDFVPMTSAARLHEEGSGSTEHHRIIVRGIWATASGFFPPAPNCNLKVPVSFRRAATENSHPIRNRSIIELPVMSNTGRGHQIWMVVPNLRAGKGKTPVTSGVSIEISLLVQRSRCHPHYSVGEAYSASNTWTM